MATDSRNLSVGNSARRQVTEDQMTMQRQHRRLTQAEIKQVSGGTSGSGFVKAVPPVYTTLTKGWIGS